MRYLIFLFTFIGLMANTQAASDCKTKRGLSLAQQLARLEPKVDLDLLGLDFFDGGGVATGYEYKVEPAHTNGLYSRMDRWRIEARLQPGDDFEPESGIKVKYSAGIKTGAEAAFYRFVKDPCRAMKLRPYAPYRMPLRSKTALGNKFKVGDYFLFRGSAGFVASSEILGMVSSSFWGATLKGSYLLEGFYQLHIVRLDKEHIRLKVLGHRGTTAKLAMEFGWTDKFQVFGVRALDRGLERVVNTTPIEVKSDLSKANLFMIDYVLDLTDPRVSKAFDRVIANAKSFRNIKQVSPFRKELDIDGMLLLDLSPLEDLFQQDRSSGRIGRIRRNLRSNSSQWKNTWGVDIGNSLFGFEWDSKNATSQIGLMQEDNKTELYLLKSREIEEESRFFYTWTKSKEKSGTRVLFKINKSLDMGLLGLSPLGLNNKRMSRERDLKAVNIVSYSRDKRNRVDRGDLRNIKRELLMALPLEVYNAVPWTKWDNASRKKYTNFGLRNEFILAPEVIEQIPELNEAEIVALFKEQMLRKGLTWRDYIYSNSKRFNRKLYNFAKILSRFLDRSGTRMERLIALDGLMQNLIFNQSGLSFIMSLRPDLSSRHFHVDLHLSSDQVTTESDFGESKLSELYKKILSVKAALDDDALDILREAESLSLKNTSI